MYIVNWLRFSSIKPGTCYLLNLFIRVEREEIWPSNVISLINVVKITRMRYLRMSTKGRGPADIFLSQ